MRYKVLPLRSVWFFATASSAVFAAGIATDGNSLTSISTPASGRQTFNIAPAIGGVSHNAYTSFNVSRAGANLNNVGIDANPFCVCRNSLWTDRIEKFHIAK